MAIKSDEILRRLTPLFREAFPEVDVATIGPETVANDVVGWDSMAHVGLMAAIEDEFRVLFKPEEITSFGNVSELVALIARKTDDV